MSAREFIQLGLTEVQAREVIAYRIQHGRFSSVAELQSVPELELSWYDRNRDRLAAPGRE